VLFRRRVLRPAATPPANSRAVLGHRLLITMNIRNVYVIGDIALVIADWSVKTRAADSSDVDMSGSTADVARRGADGWSSLLTRPFGTGYAKHVGGTLIVPGGNRLLDCQDHLISGAPIPKGAT
jgi:hypothetical protein